MSEDKVGVFGSDYKEKVYFERKATTKEFLAIYKRGPKQSFASDSRVANALMSESFFMTSFTLLRLLDTYIARVIDSYLPCCP